MSRRIAHTNAVEVKTSLGTSLIRMAVYDQGPDAHLVAVKEVFLDAMGWTHAPGGDVCEVLVSVVMDASNARVQGIVRKGGEA